MCCLCSLALHRIVEKSIFQYKAFSFVILSDTGGISVFNYSVLVSRIKSANLIEFNVVCGDFPGACTVQNIVSNVMENIFVLDIN